MSCVVNRLLGLWRRQDLGPGTQAGNEVELKSEASVILIQVTTGPKADGKQESHKRKLWRSRSGFQSSPWLLLLSALGLVKLGLDGHLPYYWWEIHHGPIFLGLTRHLGHLLWMKELVECLWMRPQHLAILGLAFSQTGKWKSLHRVNQVPNADGDM